MPETLRLMAILAHPDDESLGVGGVLARYAAEGIETHLVTATRGERGRYFDNEDRPSDEEVGRVRERELRSAGRVLGLSSIRLLGYVDGDLDQADPREATGRLVDHLRDVRPQVVVTFDPFGAYGHPDHMAISQLTTAALTAAADASWPSSRRLEPHRVSKLYWYVADEAKWDIYQTTFKKLVSRVDGVERQARPWPPWSITTRVDARDHWETVWSAVQEHRTQLAVYGTLGSLSRDHHRILWGDQTFHRAMSTVNGGRTVETDVFEGLRDRDEHPEREEKP